MGRTTVQQERPELLTNYDDLITVELRSHAVPEYLIIDCSQSAKLVGHTLELGKSTLLHQGLVKNVLNAIKNGTELPTEAIVYTWRERVGKLQELFQKVTGYWPEKRSILFNYQGVPVGFQDDTNNNLLVVYTGSDIDGLMTSIDENPSYTQHNPALIIQPYGDKLIADAVLQHINKLGLALTLNSDGTFFVVDQQCSVGLNRFVANYNNVLDAQITMPETNLEQIIVSNWTQNELFFKVYIGVPQEHPLYGQHCMNMTHMRASYSNNSVPDFVGNNSPEFRQIEAKNLWWIGYDFYGRKKTTFSTILSEVQDYIIPSILNVNLREIENHQDEWEWE